MTQLPAPIRARRGVVAAVVVVVTAAIFLLPYLWIVSSSFKVQQTIFRDVSPLSWRTFLPSSPTFRNFTDLFHDKGVGRALVNSLIVAVVQVAATVVLASMAAYALVRIRFRGATVVFLIILMTFLVPMEALVIPLYSVMTNLGLRDSLPAIFLPWIASPFALFMLRQSFEEIPRELDEAATIDGAGHFRIFWSVILPSTRASLVSCSLIIFLFSWNSFLWPLIIAPSPSHLVIQVAVAQSSAPGQLPNWGETFAGATVATIPLIIVFLIAQKSIVKGLATTGLK